MRKVLFVFIAMAVLTVGIVGCGVTSVNNTNAPEQADMPDENQLQSSAKLHSGEGLPDETDSSGKAALSDDDAASQSTADSAKTSDAGSSYTGSPGKYSPDAGSSYTGLLGTGSPGTSSSDTAGASGAVASPSTSNPSDTTDFAGALNSRDTAKSATLPDGIIEWNGFELIREDYRSSSQNVSVPNNVITTKDRKLTVFYANSFGSDSVEYGTTQVVQVKLNDVWFTIPINHSQGKEPLTLAPFSMESDPFSLESMTEYSIDLTPLGALPPGQYRCVERFFMERLQYEYYTLAYFWVINPGDVHPPEAETSGLARIEDIIFNVGASFEARRVITDRDETVDMLITNTSGKKYVSTKAILEKLQNGEWEYVEYTYSNLGLVSGWQTTTSRFYLNKQLEAGEYRIILSLNLLGTASGVEPVYTFSVIPYNKAPKPDWDISRLTTSRIDDSNLSTDVKITVANSILNKANSKLDLTVTVNKLYGFGDPYSIEVLIAGKWYSIPLNISFNSSLYTTDSTINITCYPAGDVGVLPTGQYRIIKEFNLFDEAWETSPSSVYLTKKCAMVEFTVEETLER